MAVRTHDGGTRQGQRREDDGVKLLYCGDVVGRAGRDAVVSRIPALRQSLGLDFVLVNGENAAAGFGITAKICRSEEHTSELQSLMRISYALFCFKNKNKNTITSQ